MRCKAITHSKRLAYKGSLKSRLHVGDGTADNDSHVGITLGGSQGEYTKSLIFLLLGYGLFSYNAADMPIMLDDNGDNNRPDAEFDATTSNNNDNRTLRATPPADAGEDRHTSVAAISIEPVASGQSRGSATDRVSSGRQSLSDRNVKSAKANRMVQSQSPTDRQRDLPLR